MSINSMTNVAWARRRDVDDENAGPATPAEVAVAAGEPAATASSGTNRLSAIATYIPTEVLTVYVSAVAIFGVTIPTSALPADPSASPAATAAASAIASAAATATTAATSAAQAAPSTPFPAFAVFVVLTPIVVWGLYATKAVNAGKRIPKSIAAWPKWEMFAATVAFFLWGAALPSSPLEGMPGYSAAGAGFLVLVVTMVFGVFAPLFTRKPLAVK